MRVFSATNIFPSTRRGLTQLEVTVALLIILLLVGFFLAVPYPMYQRRARREQCANNLKNIGIAFCTYSCGGDDEPPIVPYAQAVEDSGGRVTYAPGMIGKPVSATDPAVARATTEADTQMSTTRVLWLLVREGIVAPKTFYCPESDDMPCDIDDPTSTFDFPDYNHVSYGIQVPYGKFGQPGIDRDLRMILVADKGPYGAALEAGAPNPGVPSATLGDPPKAWKPWNSRNHRADGQHVMFADTHVEFATRPIASFKNDNIYTRWSDPAADHSGKNLFSIHGTPPTSNETPWSNTDSLIYP